ncbi:MAG: nicotinate (nicotinamide) nucleotide adenylyltransferase [Bdellovibrionaceae bacterium]|nr:nicotinate (nicotinamide) nucleotide adenylyltransferase [Pseudobdellovibrionaceae bacterium]
MKIGIFGGSFNPPHLGHINALETVRRKIGLDKVFIVPNAQNPLKKVIDGPTSEQRVQMVGKAIEGYEKFYEVDNQEVTRGGLSYTIDTIKNYRQKYKAEELFLIIGADHLEALDKWKDYKNLLTETNIVVTTRPGYEFPHEFDELPTYLKDLTNEIEFNFLDLKSGRSIQFVTLNDVEVSSTELRKKLRTGRPVSKYLPLSVENYISELKLYRESGLKVKDYAQFAKFCAQFLNDKKAINVMGYDLTKMSAPSEYTLIASGTSTRHAISLAEGLTQVVKEEFNLLPQSVEGTHEGRWVVVDYGALIVHIFYDFVRQEYSLEKLWKDSQVLNLN